MKILHSSDWHIGHVLHGRHRYEEFEAFSAWLAETIKEHAVDVLLVAGDVFDTCVPSNRSQELYYRCLCRVAASACRHIVIVAGNHDSPSLLNAPKELLKALDIHVVGSACQEPAEEVLLLSTERGVPELLVCAVPYLRDRDIRVAEAGESVEDKERKLLDGIRSHYATVAALAEEKRRELDAAIPIVGMGHLFAAGGQTLDGDGVRELYVGSLAQVAAGIFPTCFSYLALGHLHMPQPVAGCKTMRYSGSPLPMGFGEATQQKSVCLVSFNGTEASLQLLPVPEFQRLERVRGDVNDIVSRLRSLAAENVQALVEVIFEGDELVSDLRERLEEAVADTHLEILPIKNQRMLERGLEKDHEGESLDNLDEIQVFERCLALHEVPEDQRPELLRTYREVLLSLQEEDVQAE